MVRPGRCLARIEVGPLTRAEATGWLGTTEGVGRDGAHARGAVRAASRRRVLGGAALPHQTPPASASGGLYL